jgi:hypothetical protein
MTEEELKAKVCCRVSRHAAFYLRYVALLLISTIRLFGQVTGDITARVVDPLNASVPNAEVDLMSRDGSIIQHSRTDTNGAASFLHIPPGEYMLRVRSDGFAASSTTVTVGVAESASVTVRLPIEAVATPVEVTQLGPVYNAIFDPTATNNPGRLKSNHEVLLRFFIGPEDANNALSIPVWTVSPKILRQKGNLPLTITMTCLPCSGQSIQSQEITFSGKEQASSEARFRFTPQRSLASPQDGKSKIIMDVLSRGVQFDHLVINVQIDMDLENAIGTSTPSRVIRPWSVPKDVVTTPDVVLTVGRDNSGSTTLQIEPINPKLLKTFGKLHLFHGQLRSFTLGPIADSIMQDAAKRAALTLRAIVDSEDRNLQSLLASTPGGIGAVSLLDNIKLSDADKINVFNSFLMVGQVVFQNLFRRADPDLNRLADRLDAFSLPDRRVRILIRTKEVSFPWQLLHNDKNSTITAGDFWGFRYEITVDSLLRVYTGRIPAEVPPQQDPVSVFGVYTAAHGEAPIVAVLARQQAEFLRSKMPLQQLLSSDSSSVFLQNLRDHSEEIDLLCIYAHGSSGTVIQAVNGILVLEHEAAGPRIMFSKTQNLAPLDLEGLLAGVEDAAFLARQPIVLLNACDTGTGSISTTTEGLRFPTALLDLGARGVLATEAPVWAIFAYKFGNDLIESLAKGDEASKTLVDLRWKYLSEYGNPFGLLYSYYGQPTARITPPSRN